MYHIEKSPPSYQPELTPPSPMSQHEQSHPSQPPAACHPDPPPPELLSLYSQQPQLWAYQQDLCPVQLYLLYVVVRLLDPAPVRIDRYYFSRLNMGALSISASMRVLYIWSL